MSWEWRIFWHDSSKNDHDSNFSKVLDTLQIRYEPSEKRTDTYLVCTKLVGIKWRRDRQLEIKVQSGKDEYNGAEKWTKILICDSPVSCDSPNLEEIRHLVITQLDKLIKRGSFLNQLEEAKSYLTTTPNIKLHKLNKERSNTSKKNCSIEIVKITSLSSPDLIHYSINIESHNKDDIIKLLTSPLYNGLTLYEYLNKQGHVCGYPEFVLTLL